MTEQIKIEHTAALTEEDQQKVEALIVQGKLSAEHMADYEGWVLARQLGSSAIVGCVGFERREYRVYMQSLVVAKDARRKGVGAQLTSELFDNNVAEGGELIALTLFWNNPFYRKSGFTKADAPQVKSRDDIAGKEKHKFCTAWVKQKQAADLVI